MIPSMDDATLNLTAHTQAVKAHRSLDKRPLRQIQAVLSQPLLLSLSDTDGVQIHALPDMLLKYQVRERGLAE